MIRPNDIIIVFDRGKQVVKVDKYPLCASSRFFAELLDGPLLVRSNHHIQHLSSETNMYLGIPHTRHPPAQ